MSEITKYLLTFIKKNFKPQLKLIKQNQKPKNEFKINPSIPKPEFKDYLINKFLPNLEKVLTSKFSNATVSSPFLMKNGYSKISGE